MKNSRVETRELPGTIQSCRSPTAAQLVWLIRSVVFLSYLCCFETGSIFLFYRCRALPRGKFENVASVERVRASTLPDASKRQLYEAARTTVQGPERTELIKTKHCLQCLIFRPSFRGPVTTQ